MVSPQVLGARQGLPPTEWGFCLYGLLCILSNASDKTLARIAEYGEPREYKPSGEETLPPRSRRKDTESSTQQISRLMRSFNPRLHSFDAKLRVAVVLPPGPV